MNDPRRALAFYGWNEDLGFLSIPVFFEQILAAVKIDPNKVSLYPKNSYRGRSKRVSKNRSIVNIISDFGDFESISIEKISNNDFRTTQNSLNVDFRRKEIFIENGAHLFDRIKINSVLSILLDKITPVYGFSDIFEGICARFLPSGTGTSLMSREENIRSGDLSHSRLKSHEHLKGKMHDVYALNFLSPLHLDWPVGDMTLGGWITAGGRGELSELKPNVFLWEVGEHNKAKLRRELFDQGCLIATV